MTFFGGNRTNGTIYYDYVHQLFRSDFRNASVETFCAGDNPANNLACSTYINGGNRYLYFSDVDECCNCCNDKNGCGILSPDWMANFTYEGLVLRDNISI